MIEIYDFSHQVPAPPTPKMRPLYDALQHVANVYRDAGVEASFVRCSYDIGLTAYFKNITSQLIKIEYHDRIDKPQTYYLEPGEECTLAIYEISPYHGGLPTVTKLNGGTP